MLTNGQADGHGQFRVHFRFNIDYMVHTAWTPNACHKFPDAFTSLYFSN